MKEESGLVTIAGRRSLSGLPPGKLLSQPAEEPAVNDDGSVVRVKAQVMTRSDEGWVAVDGGGLSLVGVFRQCLHVPIAALPGALLPRSSRPAAEKEADAYSSRRPPACDKASRKDLADEPDSAIECSVADDDKLPDAACKVQCYECTEFRIRAQRITDGNLLLNYVMNKDLAYHQPQPLFHHWRCVCEACKRGPGCTTSSSGRPGSGLPHQRSLLSNQSSTTSSLAGYTSRACNNYVNLPTGKQRLSKNASVDSSNVQVQPSVTGSSSSSGFSSNTLPHQLVMHNHGSFGLTFESSADARAFDAAVRFALKTLDTEAKADAVRIGVYQVAAPPPLPNASMADQATAPSVTPLPPPKCDIRVNSSVPHRTLVAHKQSSSAPVPPDATADRHGVHVHVHAHASATKTHSDPLSSCTYALPSALPDPSRCIPRTRPQDADEYGCLWNTSSVVPRPAPTTAPPRPVNTHRRAASPPDLEAIEPAAYARPRTVSDLHIRAAPARPARVARRPDADADADAETEADTDADLDTDTDPYIRLTECGVGLRQLDAPAKRSCSLSRLNNYAVTPRTRASTPGAPATNVHVDMHAHALARSARPTDVGGALQLALSASKRCTSYSLHARGSKANANLYVCSSYPHLANVAQLHGGPPAPSPGVPGTRSSPSASASATTTAAGPKPEPASPRFLRLFRSKKRGSRCDSVSVSSISLLANVQPSRRCSKRPAGRPLTRARCVHCQQVYFVERNRRGACGDAPAAAPRRLRASRYFRAADACVHCVLDSDDSDADAFDDRGRSSRSHSSVRSSGAHEHEDSGISTFSASVSHTRRQLVAARRTDEACRVCACTCPCVASRHKRRRCARWTLVALLSCLLPCLWCYWPLACCSAAASSCCACCVGARHEPMPPSVVADQAAPGFKP